jgi:tetratricopeptide (TPR) repeat protein
LARAAEAEEKEFERAADIYRSILKVEPGRLDANLQYARLLVKRGQRPEAIETLLNLVSSLDPETQTGKLSEVLQSVTELDPLNIEARERLVALHIKARQIPQAVKSLQDLVEIYISKGDLEHAEEAARKTIDLGDQNTYYHLGVVYFNQQKYDEARLAFEKFLQRQEAHVGALKYLALTFLRLNQNANAVRVQLRILDVYFNENLLDEARQVRQTVLELDPQNQEVLRYELDPKPLDVPEGAGAGVSGDPEGDAARQEQEQQAELLAQAHSFTEKGFYEQAIDVYLDMLKRWPQLPEVRVRLQQVYALVARSMEPAEKGPSAEEIKSALEKDLREHMRRELEEQARLVQERQHEQEVRREEEQIRLKQELANEKADSISRMKAELEGAKADLERKIREQVEREMTERSEKEKELRDVLRQEQAVQRKEEDEKVRYAEQKRVEEVAKAKVNQEILSGMERIRKEREREAKEVPVAPPKVGIVEVGSLTPEALDDPFIRQTLADIYAKQGLYLEALKIYERSLNEEPNNEDVREKLREILRSKGI